MSTLSIRIGQRIRSYRQKLGMSQEKIAELSGCHPAYIGQIERGEKNATIESIAKITKALNISMSKLFEKIDGNYESELDIPSACYEWLTEKSNKEQEYLYKILLEIDEYKYNK